MVGNLRCFSCDISRHPSSLSTSVACSCALLTVKLCSVARRCSANSSLWLLQRALRFTPGRYDACGRLQRRTLSIFAPSLLSIPRKTKHRGNWDESQTRFVVVQPDPCHRLPPPAQTGANSVRRLDGLKYAWPFLIPTTTSCVAATVLQSTVVAFKVVETLFTVVQGPLLSFARPAGSAGLV